MLQVQYPAAQVVRGFVVDANGYILHEMLLPREVRESGFITAYLPSYLKCPRWDGQRWVETYGWYRHLGAWLKGLLK